MKVALTADAQEISLRKVATGEYVSVADVVAAALELMDARDKSYEERLAALERKIDAGVACGEPVEGEASFKSSRDGLPRS